MTHISIFEFLVIAGFFLLVYLIASPVPKNDAQFSFVLLAQPVHFVWAFCISKNYINLCVQKGVMRDILLQKISQLQNKGLDLVSLSFVEYLVKKTASEQESENAPQGTTENMPKLAQNTQSYTSTLPSGETGKIAP